jgi:hypothetical protein
VSIVTVQPLVMVTLSLLVGTTPPAHVAGELQLPPAPVQEIAPVAFVAWLPLNAELRAPSVTAKTLKW